MRTLFLSLFSAVHLFCFGQKICLNMIVKNERDIIARCLESVKPHIDYWVIVDTGSSDGTQEVIRQCMRDMPGELHERPWVNFGHNRNEAKELAAGKGDYLLFIDADEVAEFAEGFYFDRLEKDCYLAEFVDPTQNNLRFSRAFLLKNIPELFWKGAVHEYIASTSGDYSGAFLSHVRCCSSTAQSARSKDPNKYRKDAQLLEEEIVKDPTCKRNYFYLGQSYFNVRELEKSLQAYQKRVDFGDTAHRDFFWSSYMVALLKKHLNYPESEFVADYERAHAVRPYRVEPLYDLAQYFLLHNQPRRAYELARRGIRLQCPLEQGYVSEDVYAYRMALTFAEAAGKLRKWDEAITVCKELLAKDALPKDARAVVTTYVGQCIQNKKNCALSLAAVFSNDAPKLKVWIESNKRLGVGHFYLYNNGSTDNYRAVLKPYIDSGDLTLIEAAQGSRQAMYQDLLTRTQGVTDWLAVLNIGERIVSEHGSPLPTLRRLKETPGLEINEGKAVIVRPAECLALGRAPSRCRYKNSATSRSIAQEELSLK